MATVTLNIYDVSGHSAITGANKLFRAIGTGAFHAGVEIYGTEWSYGGSTGGYRGSGIFNCPPRQCGVHVFRESKVMGTTAFSKRDLRDILDILSMDWPGEGYDLLRHNCCHFCDALTIKLGVGPCPSWLTNLAGVGAMLRSGIRLVAQGAANAGGAGRDAVVGVAAAANGLGGAWAGESGARPAKELPNWPSAGDRVEVYSNSSQAWCLGRIESRDGDMVTVNFLTPGAESSSEWSRKTLPANHHDLRRAPSASEDNYKPVGMFAEPIAEEMPTLIVEGDQVEIYSHSQGAWCRGYVENVDGNAIMVAYQYPGAEPHEWTRKGVMADSKDLRMPETPARSSGAGRQQRPSTAGRRSSQSSSDDYAVGDNVEVFSNSKQIWCQGRVTRCKPGSIVTVAFQLPGAAVDDYVEKDVRLGDPTLRHLAETAEPEGCTTAAMAWSEEEKQAYSKAFATVVVRNGLADARDTAEFLSTSGLHRRVLREIWQVANPDRKMVVNEDDFWICCRLVGHCQAMRNDGVMRSLLDAAGEQLRLLLRHELLRSPPPQLPHFRVEAEPLIL